MRQKTPVVAAAQRLFSAPGTVEVKKSALLVPVLFQKSYFHTCPISVCPWLLYHAGHGNMLALHAAERQSWASFPSGWGCRQTVLHVRLCTDLCI